MYFFLNNLKDGEIFMALADKKGIKDEILLKNHDRRINLLKIFDQLLKKNKITVNKISGLIVVNGPGSFSGIRTALSLTNTISVLKKIPAVGISLDDAATNHDLINLGIKKISRTKKISLVLPDYGREPNITKSKKRHLIAKRGE